METREAVARAICAACEDRPDALGDARGNEKRWQDYAAVADAAMAAMAGGGVLVRLDRPEDYDDSAEQRGWIVLTPNAGVTGLAPAREETK